MQECVKLQCLNHIGLRILQLHDELWIGWWNPIDICQPSKLANHVKRTSLLAIYFTHVDEDFIMGIAYNRYAWVSGGHQTVLSLEGYQTSLETGQS